ncbi:MAG: SpoIIE family protein phosphatase [Myxococcales bacterium]|nr:SpoIIE family protein phosphatase [Myxococcales bacterium]
MSRPLVLVVDDDILLVAMARSHLSAAGYSVADAQLGAEALDRLDERTPDAILLDIDLPDACGIDLLQRFKRRPELESVPVLMLTGKDDRESIVRAFEAGAIDYIRKPYIHYEMLARVGSQLRIGALMHELSERNGAMTRELDVAARVQRSFLPRVAEVAGATVAQRYRPTTALGGDMCGHFIAADGRLALFVLDIAGHGSGAAIVAVAASGVLQRAINERGLDAATLRGELSAFVDIERTGFYATLVVCMLDTRSGELQLLNWGHPPPLLLERGRTRWLSASGSPLGVGIGPACELQTLALGEGDRLLLYSDGVCDVARDGFELRAQALELALRDEPTPAAVAEAALAAAASETIEDDDMSLLVLQREAV